MAGSGCSGWLGPGPRAVSIFFQQLARLHSAGMAPVQALDAVHQGEGSLSLRRVAGGMADVIRQGGTYTDAFAAFPAVFPPLQVQLITAAERSGRIGSAFEMLSGYLERRHRRRQRLIGGLQYPILLVHLAVLLPPVVTLVQQGLGAYLWAVVPVFAVLYGIVAAVLIVRRAIGDRLMPLTHVLILLVPVVGRAVRKLSLSRFADACQCLYEAGVPVGECVEMAARASGNRHIERRLLRAAARVKAGTPVTEALAAVRALPADAMALLAAGQQAGELGTGLAKVAEYYQFEAETSIDRLLAILPVIALLAVSAYIGYIYITTMLRYMGGGLQVR